MKKSSISTKLTLVWLTAPHSPNEPNFTILELLFLKLSLWLCYLLHKNEVIMPIIVLDRLASLRRGWWKHWCCFGGDMRYMSVGDDLVRLISCSNEDLGYFLSAIYQSIHRCQSWSRCWQAMHWPETFVLLMILILPGCILYDRKSIQPTSKNRDLQEGQCPLGGCHAPLNCLCCITSVRLWALTSETVSRWMMLTSCCLICTI